MDEILTSYDLIAPYAAASIVRTANGRIQYCLIEPELSSAQQALFQKIVSVLHDSVDPELFDKAADFTQTERLLEASVFRILEQYAIRLSETERGVLLYYLKRDFFGLFAVEPLLKDPHIEDISCNGDNLPIFVFHKHYGSLETTLRLKERDIESLLRKMAQSGGKQISVAEPMADVVLADGSRAQLTIGREITTKGSTFTIRKFNELPMTPHELVLNKTFTAEEMVYFWLCIESRLNLMFAGGTASGKTTSLNAVCRFILPDKKIVSIEDTREINLPHLNWISGISRQKSISAEQSEKMTGTISLYDLLKASLRQRPEYILVGEVRGSEAYVLFQAMSTGHTTVSTMHAESVETLIHRLENPPMNVPRVMIQTLDVLVILAQTEEEGRFSRKCLSVHEILETDPQTSEILTAEIFFLNNTADAFDFSKSAVLEKVRIRKGWTQEKLEEEWNRRLRQILSEAEK